jgi:hypothetical protein
MLRPMTTAKLALEPDRIVYAIADRPRLTAKRPRAPPERSNTGAKGKQYIYPLSFPKHLVRDQGVGGSNPLSPTIYFQADTRLPSSPKCLP